MAVYLQVPNGGGGTELHDHAPLYGECSACRHPQIRHQVGHPGVVGQRDTGSHYAIQHQPLDAGGTGDGVAAQHRHHCPTCGVEVDGTGRAVVLEGAVGDGGGDEATASPHVEGTVCVVAEAATLNGELRPISRQVHSGVVVADSAVGDGQEGIICQDAIAGTVGDGRARGGDPATTPNVDPAMATVTDGAVGQHQLRGVVQLNKPLRPPATVAHHGVLQPVPASSTGTDELPVARRRTGGAPIGVGVPTHGVILDRGEGHLLPRRPLRHQMAVYLQVAVSV